MPTHITIPIPDDILRSFRNLSHENFNLWLFLAQNDLLEEARDFLALDSVFTDDSDELPF